MEIRTGTRGVAGLAVDEEAAAPDQSGRCADWANRNRKRRERAEEGGGGLRGTVQRMQAHMHSGCLPPSPGSIHGVVPNSELYWHELKSPPSPPSPSPLPHTQESLPPLREAFQLVTDARVPACDQARSHFRMIIPPRSPSLSSLNSSCTSPRRRFDSNGARARTPRTHARTHLRGARRV